MISNFLYLEHHANNFRFTSGLNNEFCKDNASCTLCGCFYNIWFLSLEKNEIYFSDDIFWRISKFCISNAQHNRTKSQKYFSLSAINYISAHFTTMIPPPRILQVISLNCCKSFSPPSRCYNLLSSVWFEWLILFFQTNVAGFMYFWGLTIEIVTSVCLILSVGLSIDYSAHVGHSFMTSSKSTRQGNYLSVFFGWCF